MKTWTIRTQYKNQLSKVIAGPNVTRPLQLENAARKFIRQGETHP
jgi:hypothetical protein